MVTTLSYPTTSHWCFPLGISWQCEKIPLGAINRQVGSLLDAMVSCLDLSSSQPNWSWMISYRVETLWFDCLHAQRRVLISLQHTVPHTDIPAYLIPTPNNACVSMYDARHDKASRGTFVLSHLFYVSRSWLKVSLWWCLRIMGWRWLTSSSLARQLILITLSSFTTCEVWFNGTMPVMTTQYGPQQSPKQTAHLSRYNLQHQCNDSRCIWAELNDRSNDSFDIKSISHPDVLHISDVCIAVMMIN